MAGTSPCLYLVVHAAAFTACACMDIPHGLAPAGTLACVSWCGVPFSIFPCGALRLGGLFPLTLSHTLLVPWLPCPMCAGDSSGRALLLVVAWPLCFFPRALTSAPLRLVTAWGIVQHTCFGGRHVLVVSTLCCLVVLLFLLVLGRAQVPYSYCMHFAKCFGARNVQLCRLGGSFVGFFSVSVLSFSRAARKGKGKDAPLGTMIGLTWGEETFEIPHGEMDLLVSAQSSEREPDWVSEEPTPPEEPKEHKRMKPRPSPRAVAPNLRAWTEICPHAWQPPFWASMRPCTCFPGSPEQAMKTQI